VHLVAHIDMNTFFSRMKQNKSKFRSSITVVHLHDVIRIDISEIEPNINSSVGKRQA